MPELLNLWYEQLSYHKILPLVYNLSMEISRCAARWFISCLYTHQENSRRAAISKLS
jgi:hypothetical protein